MIGKTMDTYGKGAIALHWLIALALAAELAIGFGMPHDASGFAVFQLHKSIGITILLLSVLRLGWRLVNRGPKKLERGLPGFLASSVHVLFYVFMIAAPLTGWAIVSTSAIKVPTMLYGTIPWPHLPLSSGLNGALEEAHELLAFLGIGLFVLHVAGALRHHFMLKDGLLKRIAPGGSSGIVLALLAGVLALGAITFFGVGGGAGGDHDHDHEHEEAATVPAESVEVQGENDAQVADDGVEQEDPSANQDEAVEDVAAAEQAAAAQEPVVAAPSVWTIQPGGSLRFTADNGGTALNGSFRRWNGTIRMNPEEPAGSSIAIEIELASATMGDATQDQMLTGAEFFAASSFPTANFRSTSVTRTGGNNYRANGTLSIKGVNRPQVINFTLAGSGDRRSVTGSGTVDRGAFSIGTGETAAGIAGNVRVEFAFDATR